MIFGFRPVERRDDHMRIGIDGNLRVIRLHENARSGAHHQTRIRVGQIRLCGRLRMRHAYGNAVFLEQIGVIAAGILGSRGRNRGPGQASTRIATTSCVAR